MAPLRRSFSFALVVATAATPAQASEVDVLVARHAETRETIQALTCDVRITTEYPQAQRRDVLTGRYYRFGDRVRCSVAHAGGRDEHSLTADRHTVYMARTAKTGTAHSAATGPRDNKLFSPCDVWSVALFDLSLPNTIEFVPLRALVSASKAAEVAGQEELGGVRCTRLVLTFDCDPAVCVGACQVTLHVSDDRDRLVKRCTYDTRLPGGQRQVWFTEVTALTRTPMGCRFPTKTRTETRVDGTVTMTQDATISSIKTPATIPDDMFQLRFRTKTPMTDHGRMTTYWVDTDGRRVGEEEALTAAAVDQQQAAGTDTAEEPVEYGHWVILAGSVAPLAGIAIFWCVRRRTTG